MARDELDVAIVGGGLAGSALAAVLAARGLRALLVDIHNIYPEDFRAEKLTHQQIQALARLGLAEAVLASASTFDELWIARFGKLVERRPNREHGIDYACLVNALRRQVPDECRRTARVTWIEATAERQTIRLGTGETLHAKLVVVATGLGRRLLKDLGVRRVDIPSRASLAIGFDMSTDVGAQALPPLTYYGESIRDRAAYLTIFPIAGRARANLFVYRDRDDAWSRAFRKAPRERLLATMPGLDTLLGAFTSIGTPVLRPIHIYKSEGYLRDGAVLIGDAFSTTCPTGGTGIDKVLTDVERLAALIPDWVASPGMSREKIAQFYADPVKQACDRNAEAKTAYARSMATDPRLKWVARRYATYYAHRLRDLMRRRLGSWSHVSWRAGARRDRTPVSAP